MGRPKKKSVRTDEYRLRLNEDERKLLEDVVRMSGKTRSEILREGLRWMYIWYHPECP